MSCNLRTLVVCNKSDMQAGGYNIQCRPIFAAPIKYFITDIRTVCAIKKPVIRTGRLITH